MSIELKTEGRRIYFVGNTYSAKDQIKSIGGHWDADRKAWWIGSASKAEAEKIVSAAPAAGEYRPTPIERSSRVYAKVAYKGRNYYVVAEGRERVRLTVLDGSIDFWALKEACELVKTYAPRQKWGGYGRSQVEVYTTIGSLRDFIEECKEADKAIKAGEIPDGYAVDLEDGCVKRLSECDIPA